MKITLLYLRVLKKFDPAFPEHKSYAESSERFLRTYQQFRPKIKHDLVVVNCGTEEHDSMFDCVATRYESYSGGGYDCGTYQAVGGKQECDFVLCLNTHTYFWRDGWLEFFAMYAQMCGTGVYGATASFERHPHLRTPSIGFHPRIIREYPELVNSRDGAAAFESGPNNFSLWASKKGYPTYLVTSVGLFYLNHWRSAPNIYRRGNQSNCLIWDRHTDIYANADATEKAQLESDADKPTF